MRSLQTLLEEGRAILAKRKQEQDEEWTEHQLANDGAFRSARDHAIALFAPIEENLIEPKERPGGWQTGESIYPKIKFFVRPFGDQAGRVLVKLCGKRQEHSGNYEWYDGQKGWRFFIEHNFQAFDDADNGAFGLDLHTVNSLAEALAICEQEGPSYRSCIEAAKRRQEKRKIARDEAKDKPKAMSPDEALIAAFQAWHDAQPHPTMLENP